MVARNSEETVFVLLCRDEQTTSLPRLKIKNLHETTLSTWTDPFNAEMREAETRQMEYCYS